VTISTITLDIKSARISLDFASTAGLLPFAFILVNHTRTRRLERDDVVLTP